MIDLSGFEHHFFLSYAHRDDQKVGAVPGWVSHFREAFTIRLGQCLGADARPWWDERELRGNEDFKAELAAALQDVAALVPVLSPSYLGSKWCAWELDEFRRVADGERIFKVLAMEVPLADQPEELRRRFGYTLVREDPQTGRVRQLDPEIDRREYEMKIDDLAQDLAALLRRSAVAASGKKVYLAECSFDVQPQRERLRRILEQRGHRLVPGVQLLSLGPGERVRERIREELVGCDLAIHLFGKRYGARPEGETAGLPVIQYELCAGSGVDRLVWIPPEVEGSEEEQRAFVDGLLTAPPRGTEILRGSIEELAQYAQERLRPRPKAGRSEAAPKADGAAPSVYVVSAPDDAGSEALGQLEQALFDTGSEVVSPLFEGEQSALREDHKDQLTHCDALLVFQGRGGAHWLRQKLSDLRKSRGYRQSREWQATAVFLAPSEDEGAPPPRTQVEVIDARQSFSADLLEPFLSRLNDAREMG